MVPRIGRQGSSFKGAGLYYLHDKEASTSERVAFSHTENLPTDDPKMACDWMAYTAMDAENLKRQSGVKRTGGPAKKPVFTLSLSWHPEQEPEQEHMIDTANSAIAAIGLQNHQAVMVGHNDEAHSHIHVILNLIDPETGRTAPLSFTKEKLSKWAQDYELENGKIYCEQRVENNAKREQAKEQHTEEYPRYKDPELDQKQLITQLYHASDSGQAFQAALAEYGYTLAQGKRIVVIDQDGTAHSISRQIEGAKAKDIRAKLSDIVLPGVDETRPQQPKDDSQQAQIASADQEKPMPKAPEPVPPPCPPTLSAGDAEEPIYFDRDEQDRQWFESIIDAALAGTDHQQKEKAAEDESRRLNQIQNRQLEELGRLYSESGEARARLNAEMESAYGIDQRRLQAEIAERENRLQNAGRVRRFLMQVTGRYKTIQQEIEEKSLSLQNIEWRKQERADALEKQIEENRQRISARHEQERAPAPTAKNETVPIQQATPPAPQKDLKEAQENSPGAGYEARRAAFMERAQPAQPRIPKADETEALRPLARQPASAVSLSQDFQRAADYETRRTTFMKNSRENHSPAPDLSEDEGPSQSG